MSNRSFKITTGKREQVPLLVGLAGPSGSGKTYSALELATGMQEEIGGEIVFIDTENRRALHYADDFSFQHLDFGAPFGSLDYLAALEFVVSQKPAAVVVDSMSHEHEGPGGLIDFHAQEVERMSKGDWQKAQKVQMLAWQKPKAARRALLNGLVRLNQNVIMCFRAGEKSKPSKGRDGRQEIIEQGFTPIAAPEFVYEMTLCGLLRPGARGVPTWNSDKPGEHAAIKLPGQFGDLFANGVPFSRQHGRELAKWAKGGATPTERSESIDIDALAVRGEAAANKGSADLKTFWMNLSPKEQTLMAGLKDEKWKGIAADVDAQFIPDEMRGQT